MERGKRYFKIIIEYPTNFEPNSDKGKALLNKTILMLKKGGFKEFRFEFGHYGKVPMWILKSSGDIEL